MKAPPADALRKALGLAVRELRNAASYSQEGFADLVGVHRTYAGSVERGEVNISLDNLARIAAALGLPVSALLLAAEALLETQEPRTAGAETPAPRRPPNAPERGRRP